MIRWMRVPHHFLPSPKPRVYLRDFASCSRKKLKQIRSSNLRPASFYCVGDIVWVWFPLRHVVSSTKRMLLRQEPYRIKRRVLHVNYILKLLNTPADRLCKSPYTIHIIRLKLFHLPLPERNHTPLAQSPFTLAMTADLPPVD